MDHVKKACDLFYEGYNCAQSILCAFSDVTNLDEESALAIASGFGGGMGRMRSVCGACSGAFMTAGLLQGVHSPKDTAAKAQCYALIQSIAEEFKAEHKTIICAELLQGLKADNSPKPAERTAQYYAARPCMRFIATAAKILDEKIEKSLK